MNQKGRHRTTALLFSTGRNVKHVIYLEAQRHEHHARTSTCMNQKGYRTTAFFFLRVEMLNVFYILEAFKHN